MFSSAVHFHNYSGMSQFRPRPRGTPNITVSLSLDSGASHSSRHDMLAIISSRYQYGPFLFCCCCRSSQITWLLTGWKFFSLLPEPPPLRPKARGICHICHMVNSALHCRWSTKVGWSSAAGHYTWSASGVPTATASSTETSSRPGTARCTAATATHSTWPNAAIDARTR